LQKKFLGALFLMMVLNVLVKPVWIFGIDRGVQNITGFGDYGHYFALLNFCMVLGFLLDPGIHIHVSRVMSARRSEHADVFWDGLYAKLLLTGVYFVVVSLTAMVAGFKDLRLLASIMVLHASMSLLGYLRIQLTAGQRFRAEGLLSVTDKSIVILTAGAMLLWPDIFGRITIGRFVALQIGGILIAVCLSAWFIIRSREGFSFRPFRGFRRELLFSSIPFAVNVFLMTIILRMDGILLERLHPNGNQEAGLYASGFRILDAFSMMGTLAAGFLLPFVARHWPDVRAFRHTVTVSRRALMCAAILIASVGLAIPEYLTQMLYHRSDPTIVRLMRIILLALPGLSLVSIHGTLLTATGHIRSFIHASVFMAMLSLILNAWFIPRYGAYACATIAVIAQSLYAIVLIHRTRRYQGLGLPAFEAMSYLFVGLMGYGAIRTMVFYQVPVPVSVAISVVLTGLLFYATLGFGLKDLRRLLRP
jgi:O-antigen/teichoic acid export membrane protein